jgi:predicted Zn-dependent protease
LVGGERKFPPMRNRVIILSLLVALSMGSNQAFGATPKAGGVCTKLGLKSGFLVCTKVSGKLKWKIVKKAQTIKYSAPKQATVSDGSVAFTYSASSNLPVWVTSLTPGICTLGKSVIVISGPPGLCQFSLVQNGSAYYLAAKSVLIQLNMNGINAIDFRLPGALLLSQATYPIAVKSSSNLAVTLVSNTPIVCLISGSTLTLLRAGTCTVTASQEGEGFFPPAVPVTQSVEISTIRVTGDLPDTISGFQIKPVYVVPSDAADNSSDSNGYLAGILDEGNNYLMSQIGYSLSIDSTTTGYDIQYLKSQYSTEYLRTHEAATPQSTSDAAVLLTEIKAMENPGENRKDYIFFIEVPGFEGKYCGLAATPGIAAVVALQNVSDTQTCRGASSLPFENYTSKTWIHELIHNFGVDHTPNDPCDLMYGGGTAGRCTAPEGITVDKGRSLYVGVSSSQGPNILGLRVWQGHTADVGLTADCFVDPVTRLDGISYAYCPTGTRPIGEIDRCWQGVDSVAFEELIGGAWVSQGSGNYSSKTWGGALPNYGSCSANYPFSAWNEVTVESPGIRHYRWVVNGQVGPQLNIIWVR